MSSKSCNRGLVLALILIGLIAMQACGPMGRVENVVPDATAVQRSVLAGFTVSGTGPCGLFRVYWGDGSYDEDRASESGAWTRSERHVYSGWGGAKTVTAEGATNCAGAAQTSILVNPQVWKELMDFQDAPLPQTRAGRPCFTEPTMPTVRKGSTVAVTSTVPDAKIDFGCIFGGCVYTPDGEPNSVAPTEYPFQGLRKYSLVIRLGSQVVQGGNNVTFTARETATMELCLNDNEIPGDRGVWGLAVEVTEPAK